MMDARFAYEPYAEQTVNDVYCHLFCDVPENFMAWAEGSALPVFAPQFNERAVRAIAEDKNVESRVRALAYNRLKSERCAVPSRLLLGVVVETPLPRGLDTMAVYIDGRVRYIHASGKQVAIEKD